MATTDHKFVVKNGLAVGSSIDVINSSGQWIGATGTLNGATGPTGATGTIGVDGATGSIGLTGATGTAAPYTRKTTTYTAINGDYVIADTSGGAWTLTLPITPSTGNSVTIADGDNFQTNNLTVARNGSTIEGNAGNLIIDVTGLLVTLIYDGTTWEVYSSIGAQGATGYTGSTGAQGASGIGATGISGASGSQGIQGASGSTGLTGATGIDGATGISGATGATGIQGASGTIGVDGATGSAGVNGATGVTGASGTIGVDGATGVQGASGSTGLTGATGTQSIAYNSAYTAQFGTLTGATGATGSVQVSGTLTSAQVAASNGIFVNNMTIAASYTIPTGYGANSVGAVTINSGVVVTIPSGSRWVVL